MNWFSRAITSTIGRKLVMGLTGLFLIAFLVVHCSVNTLVFLNDDGEAFNKAAHFMATNLFIRVGEVVLFAGLLVHIVQAFMLQIFNRNARSTPYASMKNSSTWYSRSMGLLGTLILMFLIIHLVQFWVKSRFTGLSPVSYDGEEYENLYEVMVMAFSQLWVVIVYVLAMVSLCYHLMHGFQSAFQTLGLNHNKYTPVIKFIGVAFSLVVSTVFALMPVVMYLQNR